MKKLNLNSFHIHVTTFNPSGVQYHVNGVGYFFSTYSKDAYLTYFYNIRPLTNYSPDTEFRVALF